MNKKILLKRKPGRFFSFGCSFTGHKYPTWADILAFDLDVPYKNYGCGGAGNQYIFNMIMEADNQYNFTADDLVMICWTNLAREDRFVNGYWITPGNILTQGEYDKSFVMKYADIEGYAKRDFASLKATWEFLKFRDSQFHMMKMMDFDVLNQFDINHTNKIEGVTKEYSFYLEQVLPSFYSILWNNNIETKFQKESHEIHKKFKDGHPTVLEHLMYLQAVFDYDFKPNTLSKIIENHQQVIDRIRFYTDKKIPIWEEEASFKDLVLTK